MQVYLYNKCMICTSVTFLQAGTCTFVFEKKMFLTSQIYSVLHDDSYELDHDPNHNDSLMTFKEIKIPYYLTFSFHKLYDQIIDIFLLFLFLIIMQTLLPAQHYVICEIN